MRIWCDTSSDYDHANNHYEDDCSKDCVDPHLERVGMTFPLMREDIADIQMGILGLCPFLYIKEYEDERFLICHPMGSGHMAVVDVEALQLLKLFQSSFTLTQAIEAYSNWSPTDIQQAIALFYALGFLQKNSEHYTLVGEGKDEVLTAWIHVTNECNLRCHYCYLQKTHEDMPAEVGQRTVKAVFRSALKHDIKRVKLKYAGGEASLHMASVMGLHDYAAQLAQEYGVTLEAVMLSNGVVLSQRTIEQLKVRRIAVSISLDGLGYYHDRQRPFANGFGSSQYVIRTIDRLIASNLVPHISITVSQRNLDGLPDLIRYVLTHELLFSLSYYRENECSAQIADLRFADEQIITAMRAVFEVIEADLPRRSLLGCLLDKAHLKAPHKHTCGVGQNYLVIDQRGGVAKCQMDIGHTVATIDTNDPLQAVRDDRNGVQGLSVEEKEGCRSCTWRYWCTGGCPLLTHRATGRYDIKSPNCAIYTTLFPEVLRLEALRLIRYETPVVVGERVELSVPALL